MKVNGVDIRKYNAKQLTVDVQPPSITNNYEWMTGATFPTEFETDIQMGHLRMAIYFRGKDRNSILRLVSEFMMNFSKACEMELDGYKGKYVGFMTSSDYEKKKVKERYIVNLEFDGYFKDDELSINFDGQEQASFYKVGTRDAPCTLEIYAKENLSNYTIKGIGDVITIESLKKGETIIIDSKTGIVTLNGENAFDKVDMWEFPVIRAGGTNLSFSSANASVTVKYTPMWI